ncbi:NACHT domain-containing protein [Desulfoluna spongiiphila]|uniref:NACHT domain-containing protein n=1 Tax=Desulfoluna spongiiphila TaxID=419481 RepID=A0A1G5G495_9BACT|nr:NACHT domain-containing protein [Desulfoluna spongiiphila]SCY46191.1 NACHT domain-containing protein [Desulfoluna spongiiphila]
MNRYASYSISIIATIVGFIFTLKFFKLTDAVIFSIFILMLYALTRRIWLPEGYEKNAVRIASIGVASALLIPTPLWAHLLENNWHLIQLYLQIQLPPPTLFHLSSLNVIAATLIVFLVNLFMSLRTPILSSNKKPFDDNFPEKSYNDKLLKVANALKEVISTIDHDLYWNSEFYEPLEAKIEVYGESKAISTLVESIKKDKKTRKFLVLGDPGSGKSVALRKLALDILSETKRTGKLALYINLKEWVVKQPWSESNPPSMEELKSFIVDKASQKDHFVYEFFEEFFFQMFEHGRFIFLFDSFDEIPGVLDEEESSWLINELSQLFSRFIGGAHESRGVLASRQFRCPTGAYLPGKTLEILPFSDSMIRDLFIRNSKIDDRIITNLFRERPDWISVARNPFNASLLASYLKKKQVMPLSQADLFQTYLHDRFSSRGCLAVMRKTGICEDQLIQFCIDVGFHLYDDSKLGLETSKTDLSQKLGLDVTPYFSILKFALIARVADDQDTVSFVHRRFTEYFISQYFVQNPDGVTFDVVPKDSSGRDGMIMYCEVAPIDRAIEVSQSCWEEVSRLSSLNPYENEDDYRRTVLSLRFLIQAFRSRPECIDPFREKLSKWIAWHLNGPILTAKHALEATGLLQDEELEVLMVPIIRNNDPWLTETAIRACRHLGIIDVSLRDALLKHLEQSTLSDLILQKDELSFSFTLSQAFKPINRFLRMKLVVEKFHIIVHLLLLIRFPISYIVLYFIVIINGGKLKLVKNAKFIKQDKLPTRFFGYLVLVTTFFTPIFYPSAADSKEQLDYFMRYFIFFLLLFGPYHIISLFGLNISLRQIGNIGIYEIDFLSDNHFLSPTLKFDKSLIKKAIVVLPILSLLSFGMVGILFLFDFIGLADFFDLFFNKISYYWDIFLCKLRLIQLPSIPNSQYIFFGFLIFSSLYILYICAKEFIIPQCKVISNFLIASRQLRKIEISSSLTRPDILHLLLSINSTHRMKLIKKIHDKTISVTGIWPSMDELSKEERSELSKLDEKWIRLA